MMTPLVLFEDGLALAGGVLAVGLAVVVPVILFLFLTAMARPPKQ